MAFVAAIAVTLLAIAFGTSELLFLAVLALGFALVASLSGEPVPPQDLAIERSVDEDRVRPGRSITVTLSVTNEGTAVASDVRVVDHPPADVPVTDGTNAFATALRPGETIEHEYVLTPPRGEFSFGPATIRLRTVLGTRISTADRAVAGTKSVSCETSLDSFPFTDHPVQFTGRAPANVGGSGVEFVSTREYRRGDPVANVDWHRYARTGALATVEFREERGVTTVFLVDDRRTARVGLPTGGPDSFALTRYAASKGIAASIDAGNRTGMGTLSGDAWVEPDRTERTRCRIETAFEKADSTDFTTSFADRATISTLERRLPKRAQVVLCTPLYDDVVSDVALGLQRCGRTVLVISPDVVSGVASNRLTIGGRLTSLERTERIEALRIAGITVVDWSIDEPIAVDLAQAFRSRGRFA